MQTKRILKIKKKIDGVQLNFKARKNKQILAGRTTRKEAAELETPIKFYGVKWK